MNEQVFDGLQTTFDLIIAIHWLPGQFLWSGKLNDTMVGLCGTLSSILMLRKVALKTIQ